MRKKTVLFIVLILSFFAATKCLAISNTFQKDNYIFSLPDYYEKAAFSYNEDLVSVFTCPFSTIKVFDQKLNKVSANTYIEYGNLQLYLGKAGFKILENKSGKINGYEIREVRYYRPEMINSEFDKIFYLEVHVRVTNDRVITFWANTSEEFYVVVLRDIELAVNTLKLSDTRSYSISVSRSLTKDLQVSPHILYEGDKSRLEIPPGKVVWGRFYPGVPFYQNSYQAMLESEEELNHKFEFIMTYCRFPGDNFPKEAIEKVYEDGRILMLTLQPFTSALDWIAVPEIAEGKYDAVIKEWARGLKDIGEPVFVRPLNEMNGDWDPWCAWFFGKDTGLYIKAWRHLADIFREVGADNVLFVWNPHDRSYPDFNWNNPHMYYPGDDYVDWIGLTGYNNGTSHPADVWREFDEIYQPVYADYLKRYPDKPFMITEFSCNETGGDKARWIEQGMVSLAKNYPNIKIATWFDARDNEWLYQLDSTPQAFQEFKKGLENENYITNAVSRVE